MQTKREFKLIHTDEVSSLLIKHHSTFMTVFYEFQSSWMSRVYKRYKNTETAYIACYLSKNTHLEIIRLKEYNLNHDISLNNFWVNFSNISKPVERITHIVKETAIPKETVRRKVKNLMNSGFIFYDLKNKGYSWNILPQNKDQYFDKDLYLKFISAEISIISKFIFIFSEFFNLNLNKKLIEDEFLSQYSFYWYHFLSCQLQWLKMWKKKFKDIDIILIALQAIVPVSQYMYNTENNKDRNLDNMLNSIEKIRRQDNLSLKGLSATSISEITGIPRATCIRKLEKLTLLGFLLREPKTKRFFLNQNKSDKTKNIITKDNINFTVEIFSKFITIILNSLIKNQNLQNKQPFNFLKKA